MEKKLLEFKKKDLYLNEQEIETKSGFKDMLSVLLHSQTQVHIFHLQTKSYAEHIALQKYYDDIVRILDGIIESYQGKYGIITKYSSIKNEDYESNEQVIKYLKNLDTIVEKNRKDIKESYIQNQIDTVQELIYSTLYKLRFLK